MIVLGGDIGGTKTRLALFEVRGRNLILREENSFPSKKYESLNAILKVFLAGQKNSFERACFGIAGPVHKGVCETTNLPWKIDARELARDLGVPDVALLNDLQANAYGIAELTPADFEILNPGNSRAEGNAAVISAGTGLGEAGLYWDGRRYHPFASEGGHSDFAPNGDLDLELFRTLYRRFGHVSWERVLCGSGFLNIYAFLCEYRKRPTPDWLKERMQSMDPARVVTEAGLEGECPLCEEAVHVFTHLYGAEAGNLALTLMATGGVYLGGGIAPKIIKKLKSPVFLESFLGKGRLRKLLQEIPVKVIMNDRTALLGAGHYAAFCQGETPAFSLK